MKLDKKGRKEKKEDDRGRQLREEGVNEVRKLTKEGMNKERKEVLLAAH